MAFAGVSVIADGKLCESTEMSAETEADSGYHLLVVEDFVAATELIHDYVWSRPFMIGGHRWCLEFSPSNYKEPDFMSVFLVLDQPASVEARVAFSFIDQPELRASMRNRRSQTFVQHQRYGFKQFTRVSVLERSRHMLYGSFTIRCDVAVVKNTEEEQDADTIQGHFGNLLLSKEGSDITFEVGGKMFAAHRCVLAARSSVFKARFFGTMNEGTTTASVLKINNIKADVFERLLTFIYAGAMPDFKMNIKEHEAEDVEEETAWLLELLEAAKRFDLQGLKTICEETLACRYIRETTVENILRVAKRTRCTWLKEECMEFIEPESEDA